MQLKQLFLGAPVSFYEVNTVSDESLQKKAVDMMPSEHVLDACGLYCPEPVMLLHNKIRDMEVGECLRLIATDPSTTRDVPKFCRFLGHELISEQKSESEYYYYIRKGES